MEIKLVVDDEKQEQAQLAQPFLDAATKQKQTPEDEDRQNAIRNAISQTFQSTANLANLLPTGTVLAFQVLSPIFTNRGQCDAVSQSMTAGLVALSGISCFLQCFTDSLRDGNGKVLHGLATLKGLCVIDGGDASMLTPEDLTKYRLKFIDFVHALMSILVFSAIALFDQNVVDCFYPSPTKEMEELLTLLPVGIGVICSMLFLVFPTQRHGIGFPLSSR